MRGERGVTSRVIRDNLEICWEKLRNNHGPVGDGDLRAAGKAVCV